MGSAHIETNVLIINVLIKNALGVERFALLTLNDRGKLKVCAYRLMVVHPLYDVCK